ncbi:hypothetical protein BE20_36960 [Sorangium cellulosum]|uniref:Amino acid adenylation domain-containing protein n=1 Tax=Sorangium cellulosum TaxID=56 RepID=A0A150SF44_SORCE|nr:hypothetical protein BE18_04590 [Sorangium cellulosum]KYF97901.1 hypothetical protein BE20_36960 [Sorangium cellulosum]
MLMMRRDRAPRIESLAATFERTAAERAASTAIVGPGESVSYSALRGSVSSLSEGLAAEGLTCTVLAVLLPSDIAYMASVLAITERRGVFAPLDPAWPDARLVATLDIVRPSALVVAPDQVGRALRLVAAMTVPCRVLAVEGTASAGLRFRVAATSDAAPRQHNEPGATWEEDSLYLVNTSGSTGSPNAVEGAHRSLAQFIDWQARTFDVGEDCRVAQLAPTTFDVSLRDIFLPLCTGGTLFIPSASVRYHPVHFPRWVAQHGVDLVHSVPSVFKLVAEVSRNSAKLRGSFASVKKLFLSGERLYSEDAEKIYGDLAPEAQMINFYGPSEGTLIKAYFLVPRDVGSLGVDVVPLGTPMEGCEIHVVDEGGGVGEIVFESEFLAKGYYRNPELTAKKFSSAARPGAPRLRVYRTGDIGFKDERGVLHFRGRRDHQIKINGNRIELGEVEHYVRRISGVRDAVVVATEARRGVDPTMLCVYLSDRGLEEGQVSARLRAVLPPYMVPTNIRRADELPLLANGKVDRKQILDRFQAERTGS